MCLIPIVAPGASYHHTARQSAAFQRFPKMHNLTPLRSIICRLIWISISRMIDLVWFWVAHKVWTLNKTGNFKTKTQWRTRTTIISTSRGRSAREPPGLSVSSRVHVCALGPYGQRLSAFGFARGTRDTPLSHQISSDCRSSFGTP